MGPPGPGATANASFEMGGRDQYREAQAAYEKASPFSPRRSKP